VLIDIQSAHGLVARHALQGLDLNLLVALDVLIEERSVSRAAERLHMSQPAMSAALGRLRDYFDDPILAAHGKRMIPSAHALLLRPMLRERLTSLDGLISVSTAFDPARSQRHFRIGLSDHLATVMFNPLLAGLQREAPGVTLEVIAPFDGQVALLDRGEIDVLVTPEEYVVRKSWRADATGVRARPDAEGSATNVSGRIRHLLRRERRHSDAQ